MTSRHLKVERQLSNWLHTDKALAVAHSERQVILKDPEVAETMRLTTWKLDVCPPIVTLQNPMQIADDGVL